MYSDQTDKIQHTKPTTELFPYTTKNVIETDICSALAYHIIPLRNLV